MAAMAAMESHSESINQLESHLKKVKDHVHFLEEKLTLLKTAVGQERPEDVAKVLSQESLDTARKFQTDLTPATCPPGSDRLEDLKSEAESGQEECEQKTAAAKVVLADLGAKGKKIDAAGLALTMENHRSSELAKMEDRTGKVAEVSGDRHQVRSVDEVLEAEGISTSSKTSKMEKYEEVKSKREKDYLDTLQEVFDGPFALPMNFDRIIDVQDETQAELSQIGGKAAQGRVEVENIHENLATHLESVNEQLRACRKWRRNSLEKVPTIRAKAEEDLDAWMKHSVELVDEVSLVEELCMRQTSLSCEEQSATDKIGEAARVSPAADAALAACSEKAIECTDEIARATKETGTSLKEKAMRPLTLALEVAEASVHGLSRAVDQREKQMRTTKKELEASEDNLKQKMKDFNRGACSQTQIAQAKSEVTARKKSLKQQEEELRKVQDRQIKAQHRSDSCFASLSRVGCPAAKNEISQRGKEQAKIAGTFDIFPVQDTPVSASPESTALSMRMSLLEEQLAKIVEEKVSEKLTIQEGYRRFEIDRLEQDNQALRQELKDLKALRALDDRSDARSEISAGWELAEQEREEGASSSLPALEDGPSSC